MVKQFISNLWLDYSVRLCPSSSNIHHIVSDYGSITNDHFALRTLNLPTINVQSISLLLQNIGYKSKASYIFRKKNYMPNISNILIKTCLKFFLANLTYKIVLKVYKNIVWISFPK